VQTIDSAEITQARCAHEGCTCIVAVNVAVVRNQEYYCSLGCADGAGCAHADCGCSGSAQMEGKDS